MTQTQKTYCEWPMIFLILWFYQSMELSILRLPWGMGSLQLVPIVLCYLAITRNWFWLTGLSLVLAYIGSFTVGYSPGLYVAVGLWTALSLKGLAKAFALEGRRPFAMLSGVSYVIGKVITWSLLSSFQKLQGIEHMFLQLSVGTLVACICGWILFPFFVAWDAYFEHEADDAREINPNVLR